MKVTIENHNLSWAGKFESEKQKLLSTLETRHVTIEHIGSTAVPNLGAKPVIDILIGLNDFSIAGNLIPVITNLGYEYISKYEDVFPNRRFFIKNTNQMRSHHIHMVKFGSDFWKTHLRFRDILRSNPEIRKDYFDLKLRLAQLDWESSNDYADAKSDFIQQVLGKY